MNRDQINELYAGRIFSRETQLAARARIHWICSQVQGEKVLDIGCSQGIICLLLGREGFDCVGVDIEQDAIDYALEELKKEEDIVQRRVVFQVADAARLDFDENTFDTVILGEVLEHLVHPEKVLREAQRVLKESGRIIITVPLGLNSHPDHKRTFYPVSFLETVQPFFQTISVDTLTNYIIYCGKKEAAYDPSQISEKALLAELLSVQKKTDERNLAREIDFEQTAKNLYEQQKKLHEQIAALNSQIVSNQETNTALRNSLNENIVSLKQQITHLQWQIASQKQQIASQEQQNVSLQSKIDDLGIELNETRFLQASDLAYQEMVFQRSVRWRIGSIFVGGLRLLYDMLLHPIRFSKEADQRFRQYYREVVPPPLPVGETSQLTTPPVETLLAYPPLDAYEETSDGDTPALDPDAIPLGAIMDEFTYNCLKPEARLITFRPDNWRWILEQDKPRAIFVESAWHGNENAWQYKIAKYSRNMGDELLHLLAWAKEKQMPTIFWNKEDPPHYDRFIDTAKRFDYVFTSDADCIPKYLNDVGHTQIHALPFAAQPKIHNPLLEEPRKYPVCFSGTYYGASFPERQRDMDLLLKPALDFGLHIYDRQYGMVGPAADNYRFPDIYQPAIQGRLDYPEMVKAYKQYKVCLNVNSVKTSPTMFSRRVFELMACGTVVISIYSKGIEEMLGGDLVLFSETETETREHLEKLLGDEDYWSNLSIRGIRKIMQAHTYRHRLNEVFEFCGLGGLSFRSPSFTVVAKVQNLQEIENLRNSLSRQAYRNFNVVLLLADRAGDAHTSRIKKALADLKDRELLSQLRNAFNGARVDALSSDAEMSRYLSGDYVAIFNETDYYGHNYLQDYALAVNYSDQCKYIGKRTFYSLVNDREELRDAGHEYLQVPKALTSTLAIRNDSLDPQQLRAALDADWFEPIEGEPQILSLDRFNYLNLTTPRPVPASLAGKVDI
ncbi:MAG: hypothetical protein B6D39_08270 [Anaerolineae bacterium UTCFX2]|jgi:ubiquinone/menaquinone biosynthesis C-methylase UbiE/spore maturation protein CgeB|nr:MAG: hypothetical protein B6D39_08270 [Anaerolineae bacterium UTCFX2]